MVEGPEAIRRERKGPPAPAVDARKRADASTPADQESFAEPVTEARADAAPHPTAVTTTTTRAATDAPIASRPPARHLRKLRAYSVTLRVIVSYLWLRFASRFRSDEWHTRALHRTHLRNARRIERAICNLQGLYIKVGQLISVMSNFLPEEFRRELERLQDAVPPRPFRDIEARIREELGRSPDEVFAHLEAVPIASASIGQVHRATLANGTVVAVKVQYPNIERVVATDLRTLRRIFHILHWFVPYHGLDELFREIRAIVLEELDFRREAHNVTRVAEHFVTRHDVAFPKVVAELSTERLLVTHFEEGKKISDAVALRRLGVDRSALARQVVEVYCQQIFSDGVYHADPHPGNLLVRVDPNRPTQPPTLVFLDFGAVAAIPPRIRHGMVELAQGGLSGDTTRILRALKHMGLAARGAEEQQFEQIVEYFHTRFQDTISLESFNLKDIKFDPQKSLESLADLRKLDISLRELSANFHVPKELIILERTLLLLMGLCTDLDPALNPMTVIRPYLEKFVVGDGDLSTLLMQTSKDVVANVAALPADLRKLVKTAHRGDIRVRFANLESSSRLMYRLGHQVIFAGVGIAGAAIAVTLEGRGEMERAEWGWWAARIAGVMLLWSWWSSRGLLRRRT